MAKVMILKRNKRTEKISGTTVLRCLVPMAEIRDGQYKIVMNDKIAARYLMLITTNGDQPAGLKPEDIVYETTEE
jgi:hypothetical protein